MYKKTAKSRDGNIEVGYDEITHVCVAPNLYPLLQYILLMDDDIVFHHTYYFLNDSVPERMCNSLPCSVYKYVNKSIRDKIMKRVNKIKLRFFKYHCFPFLKHADIYAYDIPYVSLCIGNRPYKLLADSPNWMTLNVQRNSSSYLREQKHARSFSGRIQRFVFGNLYVHYHGENEQCQTIYLTEENTSPVLEGKKVHIKSLDSLWANASEVKKDFIQKCFNITNEDISLLQSRPNIFFSQPLCKDCGMTETEYVSVIQGIFQNYSEKDLIVKTHPRDTFNYKKYFPEVKVFAKPVSSQILMAMGLSPKRIITICSTAIEGFPESVECDYYSANVHPKVLAFIGKEYKPTRKVNFKETNPIR